jgi:hypothetical protein
MCSICPRHDANLDQIINEVMENDLVLQVIIDEAEMLIFPSCLLPKRYKSMCDASFFPLKIQLNISDFFLQWRRYFALFLNYHSSLIGYFLEVFLVV